MVKKKIYFILTVVLILFSSMNVNAVDNLKFHIDMDQDWNIVINIEAPVYDEDISMYIVKNDMDISEGIDLNDVEKIVRTEQLTGNGSFSYTLKLGEHFNPGKYVVIVGGANLPKDIHDRSTSFVVASPEEQRKAVNDLKYASSTARVLEVIAAYNDVVWMVDLTNDLYLKYPDDVLTMFLDIKSRELNRPFDVHKIFQKSCMVANMLHSSAEEIKDFLYTNGSAIGINVPDDFKLLPSTVSELFVKFIQDKNNNPIKGMADIDALLRKACAISMINSADRSNIMERLKAYNDLFQIDFNGDIKSVNEYELAKELEGLHAEDTSDVKKIVDDAVKKLITKSDNDRAPKNNSPQNTKKGGISTSTSSIQSINKESIEELSPVPKKTFMDVPDGFWASDYIDFVAYKNIMVGDGEGWFRPNDALTREEFLKIIIAAFEIKESGKELSLTFSDVDSGMWYYPYIKAAVDNSIAKGMTETEFGIGKPVSRQDAAVFIERVLNVQNKSLKGVKEKVKFSDHILISDYAREAVEKLQAAAILEGDQNNRFNPTKSLTRAEGAKIIYCILTGLV